MANNELHIQRARREFTDLQAGVGDIDFRISEMNKHLTAAGADASALDPEGKKSVEEISAAVDEAKRSAHIRKARREFTDLQAGVGDIDLRISEMNKHLTAAGADASALDPEGKKSVEEMSAAVDEAKRSALAKKYQIGSRFGRNKAEG